MKHPQKIIRYIYICTVKCILLQSVKQIFTFTHFQFCTPFSVNFIKVSFFLNKQPITFHSRFNYKWMIRFPPFSAIFRMFRHREISSLEHSGLEPHLEILFFILLQLEYFVKFSIRIYVRTRDFGNPLPSRILLHVV